MDSVTLITLLNVQALLEKVVEGKVEKLQDAKLAKDLVDELLEVKRPIRNGHSFKVIEKI